MWNTNGAQINPLNGTILADTGALTARALTVAALVAGDVAAVYRVEHRNAANDTTLESVILASGVRMSQYTPLGDIELAEGERARIVSVGAVVGNVQATLIT